MNLARQCALRLRCDPINGHAVSLARRVFRSSKSAAPASLDPVLPSRADMWSGPTRAHRTHCPRSRNEDVARRTGRPATMRIAHSAATARSAPPRAPDLLGPQLRTDAVGRSSESIRQADGPGSCCSPSETGFDEWPVDEDERTALREPQDEVQILGEAQSGMEACRVATKADLRSMRLGRMIPPSPRAMSNRLCDRSLIERHQDLTGGVDDLHPAVRGHRAGVLLPMPQLAPSSGPEATGRRHPGTRDTHRRSACAPTFRAVETPRGRSEAFGSSGRREPHERPLPDRANRRRR